MSGHRLDDVRRDVPQDMRAALGVGIHTGSLVAGCLGQGTRAELTILGDTVNTASRLRSVRAAS
jgi:class 3 adenylate cyclase